MRFFLTLLACVAPGLADTPIHIAHTPYPAPDGSAVVFAHRGDIWKCDRAGGHVTRLTQHPAEESSPQISPDGQTLYFVSTRSGTPQVHRRALDGGPTEQLTFHSEGARLECIAPDELSIIISGYRDQVGGRVPRRLIRSRVDVESPEEILFDDYGANARLSPDGTRLLFTRDGERLWRKGYLGPRSSKIWLLDLATNEFSELISRASESRSPMWMPDSSGFYYTSAQDGTDNIYAYDISSKSDTQLTRHTGDGALDARISVDGSTIVYRRGFDLHVLPVGANTAPQKLSLHHTEELPGIESETLDFSTTSDADFTANGLEIVFSRHGELWAMDTILKEPKRLTTSAAHEHDVLFSPDGDALYYVLDDGVDANIYKATRADENTFWWQAGELQHEAITAGPEPKSGLSFSPDGKSLAYISGGGDLWVSDLAGESAKRIITGWDRPSYDWSPDSRWITYAVENDNFNSDIFIVPADGSSEPVNISRHPDNEGAPAWSPDGKHIAFWGNRHGDEYDIFIVTVAKAASEETKRDRTREKAIEKMLEKGGYKKTEPKEPAQEVKEPAPPEDTTDEKKEEEPEENETEESEEKEDEEKSEEPDPITIDFDDIHNRIQRIDLPHTPSNIVWSADSQKIYYQNSGKLHSVAVEDKKQSKVADVSGSVLRVDKGDKIFWVSGGSPALFHKKKNTKYEFKAAIERERADHQRQVIRRIWRTMRDTFYDASLNGRDWPAMLAKYESAAANAMNSTDFNLVANSLLGELNASHMGFRANAFPARYSPPGGKGEVTRALGATFDRSHTTGGLLVASIVPGSPADQEKSKLTVGDIILSIDGADVDFRSPLAAIFNGPLNADIALRVRDATGAERDVTIRGISYGNLRNLARRAQLEGNADTVSDLSGNSLGYIHVSAMNWQQFEEFERQIFEKGYGKDGLIIDVRDNGGGFTADHLLTVLTPPRFTYTIPRNGGVGYPQGRRVYATWHKPIVVLCNQHSYSNAEIFSHAVKDLGRGELVGVPTAGGVISTGRTTILDFGSLRLPFRGWFLNRNGQDMELYPAVPDVVVWPEIGTANTPKDPQLLTAIDRLQALVKDDKANNQPKPAKYRSANPAR